MRFRSRVRAWDPQLVEAISPPQVIMEARKPATIGLTVLAYVVVTFGVQGVGSGTVSPGVKRS